jgi:hypothetical protein
MTESMEHISLTLFGAL